MQPIKTATGLLVRGSWVKYSRVSINKIHNLALQSVFLKQFVSFFLTGGFFSNAAVGLYLS